MRKMRILLPVLVLAFVLTQAAALAAQEAVQDKNFTGSFSFGYRAVDQSGAANTYREHINLDKGVRLFNFNLSYIASEGLKKLFDRIDLNAVNLGGDPYESFGLSIQKYGTYKFSYNHRKSTYFYGDLNETAGRLFDPVRFNFDRVTDSGSFNLTLSKIVNVFLNFDRYTKSGDSEASFEVDSAVIDSDKPVSEKMTQIGFGVDLHIPRYGLVFEQKHQDYANTNSLFLAGPMTFASNISTFRLNARPIDKLLLRGTAQMSNLDSDVKIQSGTGQSAATLGAGAFNRKIGLYDLDLTYLMFNKLAVIGSVRYHQFDQSGDLTASGATETAEFGFDTLGFEGGLQWQLSPKLSLTGGYRREERKLNGATEDPESETGMGGFETVNYTDTTVRKGFFGNARWDVKNMKLTADYQHGDYDDPFTMISPTLFDRFRTTLRWQVKSFNLSAGYLMSRTKNEIPGGVTFQAVYTDDDYSDLWKSSNDQFNFRFGYMTEKLGASVGCSLINFKTDSMRTIAYNPGWLGAGGEFPWKIEYDGKPTILDASFGYVFSPEWKAGASVNSYTNSGTWPIERTMFKAYVEYTFLGGFVSQLNYRYFNFKETDGVLKIKNNYSAGILEISFGYRWQ